MQQTGNQARVVDPILSEHARGYKRPGNVARALFPLAPVPSYGGQVIEFGKEGFKLYNSKRAPGSSTKRISFGYAGKPYAITPSGLEASVPRELMKDAQAVPGINLASRAVNTVMNSMELEHEYNCAQIARNAANYDASHKLTLTGTAKWTASATADPVKDIETAKEAIRASTGIKANTVLLSETAFAAAKSCAKILDRIKYTGRDSVTVEILATLFGVKTVVVGGAVVATGAADTFGDVWGNDVIIAYVSENSDANAEEPSYGYTYVIDGMPSIEVPYWDNNTKSWVYGVAFDNSPVLSGMTAGYLLADAGLA